MFACGALMLLSVTLTALDSEFLRGSAHKPIASGALGLILFKLAAIPTAMLLLFLIYWLMPNCKVPALNIIRPAILVGLLLELLKYINLLTWPYLRTKLALEYGPFVYSITIILWGFLAALLVLAGAEWTARRSRIASAEAGP
jgi:membrane protein